MGRRTVLLVVAALIAALGTSLVFLYVRGVDARADEQYEAVKVLTAVKLIETGETLDEAKADGKIAETSVARGQVLSGVLTDTVDMGEQVALTNVYPGEQIISSKFGSAGDQDVLTIPDAKMAMSVELTDPARVAGFVNPGADVAVYMSTEPDTTDPENVMPAFTRLLLPRVQVIGVGTTTVVPTTTTDEEGTETTEPLPRTLLTVAVDQDEAEKLLYAAKNGEVAVALLTDESSVQSSPGVTSSEIFE